VSYATHLCALSSDVRFRKAQKMQPEDERIFAINSKHFDFHVTANGDGARRREDSLRFALIHGCVNIDERFAFLKLNANPN
jgi:hypothetical protein